MNRKEVKHLTNYTVNQKTREVIANNDKISDLEFKQIERYEKMGYKVIMLHKPKRNNGISGKDLKVYLNGKIDNKIYNELVKKVDNKENYFKIRSWLKEKLQEDCKNRNKPYIPVTVIINMAKKNEKREIEANIEKYKQQEDSKANEKLKSDNSESKA